MYNELPDHNIPADSTGTPQMIAHPFWAEHHATSAENIADSTTLLQQIAAARSGSLDDLTAVYLAHEALARRVAKTYLRQSIDVRDLFQEAYIGIVQAVRNFNATCGVPFSRYATYWMRHCCGRFIVKQGHSIALSEEVVLAHRKVYRCVQAIQQAELHVTKQHLLDRGCTPTDILHASYYQPCPTSLTLLSGKAGENFAIPQPTATDTRQHLALNEAIATLPQREWYVITQLYGLDHCEQTVTALATLMNVTRQRIQQIHSAAIVHLRAAM